MKKDNVVDLPTPEVFHYLIVDSHSLPHLMQCASVQLYVNSVGFSGPNGGLLGTYYNPVSVELMSTSQIEEFLKESS